MAVSLMKTVSISGSVRQMDQVLEACAKSGCFHPEMTGDLVSGVNGFVQAGEENPYNARLAALQEALTACGVVPKETSFDPTLSEKELDAFLTDLHEQLNTAQKRKGELEARRKTDETALEQLSHFKTLDVPLDQVLGCEYIKVRFGRLPLESYQKLSAYEDSPYILFVPCSTTGDFAWGMYVAPADRVADADRVFASLFFERLRVPADSGTPAKAMEQLQKDLENAQAEIDSCSALICSFFDREMEKCMRIYTYLKCKSELFDLRRYCARYKDFFLLVGWVPEEEAGAFAAGFSKMNGIDLSVGDAEDLKKITPPSRLKNHRIFRPYEMYVSMYGLPSYNETDPTAFVAITYTILFGIMFADAGQGILLAIVGFLMYKLKGMGLGKILIPCGISATIFGLMTGSVFGFEELLNPVYQAMGFAQKPIDVMNSSTTLLGGAIGIGVVLLVLAMAINIVSSLRRKDFASAIFGPNGLVGIVLYGSILALIGAGLLNLPIPTAIPMWVMIATVLLVFFREPLGALVSGKKFKPDSVGDFCIETGAELFEILLSYFTNTISFLRVGAFMLVHAGMMQVFFSIADMCPAGVNVFMIVLGNVFVMALEGLLVGIQALRLEFYEMFNRFYEGAGREYAPIRLSLGSNR